MKGFFIQFILFIDIAELVLVSHQHLHVSAVRSIAFIQIDEHFFYYSSGVNDRILIQFQAQ